MQVTCTLVRRPLSFLSIPQSCTESTGT
ncbi:unnamed protein product [Acanthoscelides obtectus]|uniref:Uncharacterized protein n=1 Tax=Acanthoscelides obtectus TaxID=200917 RepID=A0A9P0KY18_ACAOB|nr:unnamed protein product [Acanthoscelides obtectus]CAK1624731.1 hypothetical protein AOBTE_LOCUS2731 [Acanthoscelides obtectus]